MNAKTILFFVLCATFAGCASTEPKDFFDPPPQPPHAVANEETLAANSSPPAYGSLWKRNQTSLFAANKANRVGDILTVLIYERASAKKEAETSTDRSSSAALGIPRLFGIETSIANRNPNLDPSQLISASSETGFQGTGSTSRDEQLSATLTTRVVEELEGGLFRIQGSKTVKVNQEDQLIRLSGIVRPADINTDNTIDSKYILDARIEYLGKGVISEKQSPGWLVRLIDSVWPF